MDIELAPLCGLVTSRGPVPLEGVRVEAKIRDLAVRQVITQRYRNTEAQPVEAVYVFPLDEGAAVCGFEAVVGGVVVTGEIHEREAAFKIYDDAIAEGHGAFLLDQEKPDVFTASVGNLLPGAEVLVRITTVAELAHEGAEIRYTLPTTVSPRYVPDGDPAQVRAAAAVNPPVAWRVPYGLELEVGLEMSGLLRGVSSPTHPVSLEIEGPRATVRLAQRDVALDRDFVLLVKRSEPDGPQVVVEEGPDGESAVFLTFRPSFHESEAEEAPAELIFLVDRSGSMAGISIAEARNALQLCLRSLRDGIDFNVAGFGDTFEMLFPESRPYGELTLQEASGHVKFLDADMGGTEILPALEAVFQAPPRPGRPRQLFVLTDGEVSNTEEVIRTVRRHASSTRVFTFGIGSGASHHLVKGMARAGNGEAEFIAPGERIEEKVLRQLERALTPACTEVSVDWSGAAVRQAPHRVPPVFSGELLAILGLVTGQRPERVTLRGRRPSGRFELPVEIVNAPRIEGNLVSILAARRLIRDLEEGSSALHDRRGSLQAREGASEELEARVKDEIIRLSKKYGVTSKETSFVAVERRADPVTGEMQLRRIPVALTTGWGGARGVPEAEPPMEIAACEDFDLADAEPEPEFCTFEGEEAPLPSLGEESTLEESLPGDDVRVLDRIVGLQKADGSWDLDAEFVAAVGVAFLEMKAVVADEDDPEAAARALATAAALVYLELYAAREKNEWRMLGKKAEKWLAKQTSPRAGGTWIETARRFFG
ncbi:MAG: hypothetical protein DIJKHBIC_01670 [Thermoanaerobaculia bacterium]|nr:hypothetical protein [Thermoanaerobaculia bacterium]